MYKMQQRRLDTKTHQCNLPEEPDDVVTVFIDSGIFVKWRRNIKRITMISRNHPMTSSYSNSLRGIRHEQKKHLLNYYHMIHPYSMYQFWFRLTQSFNMCLFFFVWPPIASIMTLDLKFKIFFFPNIAFMILILQTFVTGYHDSNKHVIVMKPGKVFLNYLFGYLIFDLLALGPFYYKVGYYLGFYHRVLEESVVGNTLSFLLPLFKFARYKFVMDTARETRLYFRLSQYILRTFKIVFTLIFILFFINVFLYFAMEMYPNVSRTFVDASRCTLRTVLMINSGHKPGNQLFFKLYPIALIIVGFILHLILFNMIFQLWIQVYSTDTRKRSIYDALNAFMVHKAVPDTIKDRVQLYLNFKYRKNFYKKATINAITSEKLQEEIIWATSRKNIENVSFLKQVPENLLKQLVSYLVREIYLPEDIIAHAGAVGTCMYFILTGTVAVLTSENKHVCFLRDGAHFGEITLMSNIPRVVNVVAISPVEVLRLDKKNFLTVMSLHPELMNNISKLAMNRIAAIRSITEVDENVVHIDMWRNESQQQAIILMMNEKETVAQQY